MPDAFKSNIHMITCQAQKNAFIDVTFCATINNVVLLYTVYGAVIMAESSPGSSDECRTVPSGRRPSDQAKRLGL